MRIALGAGESGLGGVRFNQRVVDGLAARLGRDLEVVRVGSWRSGAADATRRLPIGWFQHRSLPVMRVIGAAAWGSRPLHRMDVRLPPARHEIVTILDLAPLHFEDEGAIADWVLPSIRNSRGALCLSPTVAEEVERIADIPTWITGAGVDPRFFDAAPLDERELAALGISGDFALSVGGTTKRKNLALLAECWPLVRHFSPMQLVSLGPNRQQRSKIFSDVPGVRLLDQLPDELVPRLVAAARVLLVPSTYEGFGMPVAEAMAAGTPVVAANMSSLPWVAGGAAHLVEPEPAAFAQAVLMTSSDDALRTKLAASGRIRAEFHTWEKVVEVHLGAYEDAFERGGI